MKNAGLVLILMGLIFASYKYVPTAKLKNPLKKVVPTSSPNIKLETQKTELKSFLQKNPKYNSEIGFFIDMGIRSGKKRFFVYDLKKDSLLKKGMVAHGSGSETGIAGKLKFSNVNNSHCTSLGKYSIGDSYLGSFGKAYKLHGLDSSNSNAFERNIVLHQYEAVPFQEQSNEIVNSLGCPMVNETFFAELEKTIDSSKKKIILTIYY